MCPEVVQMMMLQQTEKVPGKTHTYRRTNRHQATNAHKFAGSYLQMIKHNEHKLYLNAIK